MSTHAEARKQRETLEAIVDEHGFADALNVLADIAFAKADAEKDRAVADVRFDLTGAINVARDQVERYEGKLAEAGEVDPYDALDERQKNLASNAVNLYAEPGPVVTTDTLRFVPATVVEESIEKAIEADDFTPEGIAVAREALELLAR